MDRAVDIPTLAVLGDDLRRLSGTRRVFAVLTPFLSFAITCAAFALSFPVIGVLGTVVLTFVTYGSVSHDLVHKTYGLPKRLNNALLVAIELLTLRSGTAYRLSHVNHHRHYPSDDVDRDPEAIVAGNGVLAGLRDGPLHQLRIFRWAWHHHSHEQRRQMAFELGVILAFWSLAFFAITVGIWWLLAYAALVTCGAWTIPLITVTIPHVPDATTPETQTRYFRGRFFDVLAFGHLYHLEHHLFPMVPHQNWPELGRRLDPHFAEAGLHPVTLEVLRGRA